MVVNLLCLVLLDFCAFFQALLVMTCFSRVLEGKPLEKPRKNPKKTTGDQKNTIEKTPRTPEKNKKLSAPSDRLCGADEAEGSKSISVLPGEVSQEFLGGDFFPQSSVVFY